jgi:hypothetical protein
MMIKPLSLALTVLALLTGIGLALGFPAWTLRQTIGDGTSVAFGGKELAGQSITLHLPGLNGFAVQPAGVLPDGDARLILHLRPANAPEGPDLLTASTRFSDAWDGAWLRFSFPSLRSTYPAQVLLLLESPEAPLSLRATSQDYYPEGSSEDGGDLIFEARFGGSPWARLAALPGRLAENKPGLLGWSWFYPLLLLALTISAVWAGAGLYAGASSPPSRRTSGRASLSPAILPPAEPTQAESSDPAA